MRAMNSNTSTLAIRPEAELLLRSARVRIDAETAARIEALASNTIDWDYLISIGTLNRVLPLLYRTLNQVCPNIVPAAILDFLREYFHLNTKRNFFLTSELLKLLKVFEQQGISAISFKGPLLAASIYGSIALRQFSDLDILVHKQDIIKAKQVLISQGFASTDSHNDSAENSDFVRDVGEIKIKVDLQWRITPKLFSFDSDRVWNHLEPFSLWGGTVLTFTPDMLLLILCVHGWKHRWQRLKWVCDVAQLIELIQNNNREIVFEQSIHKGNRRMLSLGLLLAHELLGAALPASVLQNIRSDSTVKSVAIPVRNKLFVEPRQASSEGARTIFYFKMMESWGERPQHCFQYLVGSIFSPTSIERSLLPLPRGLTFLYYAFRPLRLLLKYASRPFKRDG